MTNGNTINKDSISYCIQLHSSKANTVLAQTTYVVIK